MTSYVYATADGQIDRYGLTDPTEEYDISSVKMWVIANCSSGSGSSNLKFGVYIGTTYYQGGDVTPTTSWSNYTNTWTTNPATGTAWTLSAVQSLIVYINCADSTPQVHVTQIGVVVEYSVQYYWAPTFTSTPPTAPHSGYWWSNDAFSYTVTLNESSTIEIDTKPSWMTWTSSNSTLWGRLPNVANTTYDVKIKATSVAGSLSAWQNFTMNYENWKPYWTSTPPNSQHITSGYKDLIPTADSWVWMAQPNSNYGTYIVLASLNGQTGQEYQYKYPIFRWNVSLPPGSTITNAYFWLYTTTSASSSGMPVYYTRRDVIWGENWVTWNNWYQDKLGGDLIYTTPSFSGVGWKNFTSTNLTNNVKSQYQTDGRIFLGFTGQTDQTIQFSSKEGSYPSYLRLRYSANYYAQTLPSIKDYYYDANATDHEGQLQYSIVSTNWSGLQIDSATGVVSKSAPHTPGQYYYNISATDGLYTVYQTVIVTVTPNHAPQITSSPTTTISHTSSYSYTITATDSDGDTLTYGCTQKPSFLTFTEANKTLWGRPTSVGQFSVKLYVTDGYLYAYQNYTLTVTNQNPIFTSSPTTSVWMKVGNYTYDADATDSDGDPLTFSCSATNFTDYHINSSTGLFFGNFSKTSLSPLEIRINVTDGIKVVWQNFTVTVWQYAPNFTSTPITTATELVQYSYTVTVEDAEGGSVYIEIITKPSWLTWNSGTKTLSGIPPIGSAGQHYVKISAHDDYNAYKWQNFTITVAESWRPVFTSTPVTIGTTGGSYYYDADTNVTCTFIMEQEDVGGTLSINGITGVVSGTFLTTYAGTKWVHIKASTGDGRSKWQNYTITITDTIDPVADAGSDIETFVGSKVLLNASGSSDNIGITQYVWKIGQVTIGTGVTVEYQPTEAGTFIITLIVYDAANNLDSDTMNLKVASSPYLRPMDWTYTHSYYYAPWVGHPDWDELHLDVNEETQDGDASYVRSVTTKVSSDVTFNLTDYTEPAEGLDYDIEIVFYYRLSTYGGAGDYLDYWIWEDNDFRQAEEWYMHANNAPTQYTKYSYVLEKKWNGEEWTIDDINDLRINFEVIQTYGSIFRVTQVYVIVLTPPILVLNDMESHLSQDNVRHISFTPTATSYVSNNLTYSYVLKDENGTTIATGGRTFSYTFTSAQVYTLIYTVVDEFGGTTNETVYITILPPIPPLVSVDQIKVIALFFGLFGMIGIPLMAIIRVKAESGYISKFNSMVGIIGLFFVFFGLFLWGIS